MAKNYRDIRLFKNPVLEKLTHVHPIVPLLMWGPVSGWLIWRSIAVHNLSPLRLAGLGLLAVFTWTVTEYLLHRYLFHFGARGPIGKKVIYLIHGNHHDEPMDPTRLVMPPAASLILAALFYGLFWLVWGPVWVEPFFAFFLVGYLWYDYTHFAVHHFVPRTSLGKWIKQNHMTHHFVHEDHLWGVSTPLWDFVFGTYIGTKQRAGRAGR